MTWSSFFLHYYQAAILPITNLNDAELYPGTSLSDAMGIHFSSAFYDINRE